MSANNSFKPSPLRGLGPAEPHRAGRLNSGVRCQMKLFRVSIEIEYELPDATEVIDVVGEPAFQLHGLIIHPAVEFWQLVERTPKQARWQPADEETVEIVAAAERRTAISVVPVRGT